MPRKTKPTIAPLALRVTGAAASHITIPMSKARSVDEVKAAAARAKVRVNRVVTGATDFPTGERAFAVWFNKSVAVA